MVVCFGWGISCMGVIMTAKSQRYHRVGMRTWQAMCEVLAAGQVPIKATSRAGMQHRFIDFDAEVVCEFWQMPRTSGKSPTILVYEVYDMDWRSRGTGLPLLSGQGTPVAVMPIVVSKMLEMRFRRFAARNNGLKTL